MTVFWFVLGLVALVGGAELLVRGATKLALQLGISPLVVGLTVVAFGTSAPEIAVSVGSSLEGQSGVAVGNVVGSNIFNLLFILGLSAVVAPLAVGAQVVRQEGPVLLGVTLLAMAIGADGRLGRGEGLALLALLVAYTVFLVVQSRRYSDPTPALVEPSPVTGAPALEAAPAKRNRAAADVLVQLALIGAGLAGLVVGAGWVVDSATAFARALGVGDLVIGLTIVAAGTSLPEVATSVTASLRGQRDIAVGNVVGSNVFNLLACLGAAAAAGETGLAVPAEVVAREGWIMLAATAVCLPMFFTGHRISRIEGACLLGAYVLYATTAVLRATESASLAAVELIAATVVMPLAMLLLVIDWRKDRRRTA